MIDSIYADIKRSFRSGNVLTRIIIVNVAVFVLYNLVHVFTFHGNSGQPSGFFEFFRSLFVLPSAPMKFLTRFWTLITYMFTHHGFFHIIWNMLLLYWFGRIIGDFLGDRRVLPIYLLAGICGGLMFFAMDHLLSTGSHGNAFLLGASGAVMGLMVAAATLSPDYTMSLILLGPVKIKYIAGVLFFLSVIGTTGGNAGGEFAHIGGALFGLIYILQLKRGIDLTAGLQQLFSTKINFQGSKKPKKKAPLKIVHDKRKEAPEMPNQDRLDTILDKIKDVGFENLTSEEKDYLNEASKT